MKIRCFSLIFLVSFLLACDNDSKNSYLEEVDRMETSLDGLHTIAFDTISNDNTHSLLITSVQNTLQRLKQNYQSDTIDYELAKKLDAYKEIENALSINSGNLAKAKQAIEDTQEKVRALKHDIEKGINDRNSYQDFIDFEKNKIHQIEEMLTYYFKKNSEYQLRYDTLHPVVKQLVEQLESQNNE